MKREGGGGWRSFINEIDDLLLTLIFNIVVDLPVQNLFQVSDAIIH